YEITYEIGLPGSDDVINTYVYRMFNRYKWERVRARDQCGVIRDVPTGKSRGTPSAQQFEYQQLTINRWAYVLFQKYELWCTDMTLDAYYNFVTGAKLGIPAGAYGVGKIAAKTPGLAKRAGLRVAQEVLRSGFGICAVPTSTATGAATVAATPAGITIAAGLA